jgi:hypothetical protein
MKYQLVFDVAQDGYRYWWFVAIGVLVAFFGHLVLWICKQEKVSQLGKPQSPQVFLAMRMGISAFALFWATSGFFATYPDYVKMRNALRTGDFTVVQGRVTQFVPMPYEGHKMESFVVSGRLYKYSDFELSAGFNNTRSHGGPIKENLQVRIADVNGRIARLEILK